MWSILKLRPLVDRATGRLNVVQAPVDGELAPSLNASADDRSLDGDGQLSAQNTDVQVFAQQAAGPRPPKDPSKPKSIDTLYKKCIAAIARGEQGRAIEFCQSILRVDPAHINARAELGRLRFVQPPQPLIDEIRHRNPIDICEVIIEVRNPCNYRCHYCVGLHNDRPVAPFDLEEVERSLSAIPAKLVVISFDAGGGEPTIHPQFPELLRLCATRGPVSFPTNNSQNPERWLPRDVAKRIYIRAALHPEAEERLDKYVRHARYLIEAGCEFSSLFVSHPERIPKIPKYRKFFADMGVPFTPVSFIGEYEGQRYPHAYRRKRRRCSV